jgi:hypothetical protein
VQYIFYIRLSEGDLGSPLLSEDMLKNPTSSGASSGGRKVVLAVDGMMCMKNCGTTVRGALMQVGVCIDDVLFCSVDPTPPL